MSKQKIIILLLSLVTVAAIGITVWTVFFRESAPVLAPDYAPQQTEQNAEPIESDDNTKLEAPSGGGAVSLTYSKEASISLSHKKASLMFANPSKSTQDMVLQLVIKDKVIVQSGKLVPGNQVTTLELLKDSEKQLVAGGYDGKLVVLYYDQSTGEKAMVNTEIPVTITVTE